MWFTQQRSWLDYTLIPITLFNVIIGVLFSIPVALDRGALANGIILMVATVILCLFNAAQIALLFYQLLRTLAKLRTPKSLARRFYLLRILDLYLGVNVGYGLLQGSLYMIDDTQFYFAGPIGWPKSTAEQLVQFILINVQLVGGIGFGSIVPQRTAAMVLVSISNVTGWIYDLIAGAMFISVMVEEVGQYQSISLFSKSFST